MSDKWTLSAPTKPCLAWLSCGDGLADERPLSWRPAMLVEVWFTLDGLQLKVLWGDDSALDTETARRWIVLRNPQAETEEQA